MYVVKENMESLGKISPRVLEAEIHGLVSCELGKQECRETLGGQAH